MSRSIRVSAKALILREGRMAAIRVSDGRDSWFILPGGGQEAEETLEEAVSREVAEEMGLCVKCGELLFAVEGVHGEEFHRIDLVFACEVLGKLPDTIRQCDTGQVGIDWLDVSELNTLPLYPSRLRRQIMRYCAGQPHRVYLGNEEIGDPEATE